MFAGQVAEALHTIHSLQTREDSLQRELELVRQFLEAAQVEGEEDRIRIMQAEDEMLSLQVFRVMRVNLQGKLVKYHLNTFLPSIVVSLILRKPTYRVS